MHDRLTVLANDLRIWFPRWGCSRAMSLFLREKQHVFDQDTVSDISFYFFSLPNILLSRAFAKLQRRRIEMIDLVSALFFHD